MHQQGPPTIGLRCLPLAGPSYKHVFHDIVGLVVEGDVVNDVDLGATVTCTPWSRGKRVQQSCTCKQADHVYLIKDSG